MIKIIFIHVGKKFPSHLVEALKITKKIAQKSEIILIANRDNFKNFSRLDNEGIKFISIEEIEESNETKTFKLRSSLDQNFRDGFWFNTSYRFLILSDYIINNRLKNVLHLENDYVLYFDPNEKLDVFRSYADFAVPLDRARAIPGIVWIKDDGVANELAKYISKNPDQNDMVALGNFCNQNKKILAKGLPTIPYAYASQKGLNLNQYSSHIDAFGGVFDAAAIGQYVGGIHWMNDPRDSTFFINESSDLILKDFTFSWNINNGYKRPALKFKNECTEILSMHAHSKDLIGISPFNHGIPCNENTIVTGSRLQALCDLTIVSKSIVNVDGRENIKTEELVELPEDYYGNLLPPSCEMIEKVSRSEVIFLYTNLVEYFKKYFAKRIKHSFILISHNSDKPVTIRDYQLLNNPNLKLWLCSSSEFSHTKLRPLPYGLENNQNKFDTFKNILKSNVQIKKDKLLYVNFRDNKNYFPGNILEILNTQEGITIESEESYEAYLKNLVIHKFVLCPRVGNIDSCEFWEAQYLDCIPIIIKQDWISAFSELPILILESWEALKHINLEMLYIIITNKCYSRDILNLNKIEEQISYAKNSIS